MKEGWDAKGLLRPLWRDYPGGRDHLASAVGTTGSTLSSINTGNRNLGHDLAARLAAALDVSLLELGAPVSAADEPGQTLLGLLEELRATVVAQQKTLEAHGKSIRTLRARLAALERRQESPPRAGGVQ